MAPAYDFRDVTVGDTITFQTIDNGFGGSGLFRDRTGTVTAKTDKTVTVYVGGGDLVYRAKGNRGEAVRLGATARIRRVDWHRRNPRLVEKAPRLPYGPEAAIYRTEPGGDVYVYWTGDPAKAAQLAAREEIPDRLLFDKEVEVVATARRFTKAEGAAFSGWVVESGHNPSDPLPTKPEAMHLLKLIVADYWEGRRSR